MIDVSKEQLEVILANSYKDFHAEGLDYVCLKRTPTQTVKIYFYTQPNKLALDLVAPHNHRYNFDSIVLAGSMINTTYKEDESGKEYNKLKYFTPLNGGQGFIFERKAKLVKLQEAKYTMNQIYEMKVGEIHTIKITEPNTILMLYQEKDILPLNQPTATYFLGDEIPLLDGLYNKFTKDELMDRLDQISVLLKNCSPTSLYNQ